MLTLNQIKRQVKTIAVQKLGFDVKVVNAFWLGAGGVDREGQKFRCAHVFLAPVKKSDFPGPCGRERIISKLVTARENGGFAIQ